ncbi:MAG: DUF4340 domain-containing protein [Chloroflexi bacterium]|nr:DUF4340 domain-containing protein [Chloroflexota bacterium]
MSIRTTVVLLTALVLVAGYLFFYEGSPAEKAPDAPWFYSASMEDITQVRVRHGEAEVAFSDSLSGWHFDDPKGVPVDLARWGGITLLLSGPQSRRLLAPQVDSPATYGLDKPSLIDVTLTGQRKIEIALGSKTPDGVSHYAQQTGDPRLFLVDSAWGDVITRLVTNRPYPAWYYKLRPGQVVFLQVTAGGATASFTQDEEGWRAATEARTPVDPTRWAKAEPLLAGPPSFRVLQEKFDDPASYGLEKPAATIAVEYRPPATLADELRRGFVLNIGNKTPDGAGYYAQAREQPYLLFVDASWFEAMAGLAKDPPLAPSPSS